MSFPESINRYLDALPRPRLAALGREVPTFRTCGVAGFYLAVVVLIAAGLVTGGSLFVLAVMALVSALSFYTYAHLRRWITGYEELVLLEQVWFAMALNAVVLYLLNVSVVAYLDLFCVALCPFLAAGRVGCTLVGCCHGNPSTVGITYNDDCVRDGFSSHLTGVRLFPAPLIEAAGLLVIGITGFLALPFAAPGKVLTWYLLAYAVMRFGLEGIRGDYRPHLLDLSQARWMAIIEIGVAASLKISGSTVRILFAYAAMSVLLIVVLAIRSRRTLRRRRLSAPHLDELRILVATEMKDRMRAPFGPLKACVTSQGVSVVVSRARLSVDEWHVSLRLAEDRCNLPLLCELAAAAFPELGIDSANCKDSKVVHVLLRALPIANRSSDESGRQRADALYGNLVRRLQADNQTTDVQPGLQPELRTMVVADEAMRTSSLSWALHAGRPERGA